MITKQQKKELVKDLTDRFKRHKSVVFTDYTGLKVNEMQTLRRDLKKQGVDYQVTKKTLFNLAVKDAGISDINVLDMAGQVAVAFSYDDEVAPAKILADFSKKNQKLKIISGILNGKIMEAAQVMSLASLPNLETLRAQFVSVISAPVRNFVSVLQGNLRGLVVVLNEINKQKQ